MHLSPGDRTHYSSLILLPLAVALPPHTAASASAAALVTHPADVVKTRLQVLSATKEGAGMTAMGLARSMLQQEGPRVSKGPGLPGRVCSGVCSRIIYQLHLKG